MTKQDTFIGREVKYLFWDKDSCNFVSPILEAHKNRLKDPVINSLGKVSFRMMDECIGANNVIPIESIGLQARNGEEVFNGSLLEDDEGNVYEVVWIKNEAVYLLAYEYTEKTEAQEKVWRHKQFISFYNEETGKLDLNLYGHSLTSKEFIQSK